MGEKQKKQAILKMIVLLLVVAVVVWAAWFFDVKRFLSPEYAQQKVGEFGIWAPIIFIGLFVLVTISFLPAVPLDLVAGALFGTAAGLLYVVVGATIGATLAFIFTRTLGKNFVERLVKKRFGKLEKYYDQTEKQGFKIMLFLRLIPLFPFNGLNFAMGLTKIRFRDYLLGTAIGIVPGAFSYVYFGNSIANVDFLNIAIATALLLMLSAIYPFYKKFRKLEKNEFDVIVVGAGAGGLNVAGFMNRAGFKTLLISKQNSEIGGDCLNFGCIPSKALIHVAKLVEKAKQSKKFGLEVGGNVEMHLVRDYIQKAQGKVRKHENAEYFEQKGMRLAIGRASFVSKNEVVVDEQKYLGKKIILATGSSPRKLDVPSLEKIDLRTNETIFDLEELPRRLLIVGAGPIGIELGQAFANLGSKVVFVHRSERCLNKEGPEVSKILFDRLEKQGVKFNFNSEVEKFVSKTTAIIKHERGDRKEVSFDVVLSSIGREVNLDGLALEKAGIELKEGKLVVDKYLRTTNKKVFACGDVAGSYQFTHAAELHAKIILNNFFSPLKKKLSFEHFGWVTFSDPEIATFGLSEEALRKKGVPFNVLKRHLTDDDRAITDDYQKSFIKIIVGKRDEILGGSIVSPQAGEIVQELILAASSGLKAKSIFNKIYPYPTAARINKAVISEHYSKKLNSGFSKKILKLLY